MPAAPKKLYLIVAKGKQKGFPIPINVDLFLIGSKDVCQLRSKLPGIAEEHCAVVTRDRKVFILDMNSGEVTNVNGKAVPPGDEWPLHSGDRIEIGPLEFMVQFREKELSKRDLEEWASKCLDVQASARLFDEGVDEFHRASDASSAAANIIEKLNMQKGVVMGRLRIGRDSGVTTVRFNDLHLVEEGEVALVSKELREHLSRPQLRILLDFKNVRRLSTAGASMVGEFARSVKSWGSTLAICRLRQELQGMIATLSTHKIPIYRDKRTAIASKW